MGSKGGPPPWCDEVISRFETGSQEAKVRIRDINRSGVFTVNASDTLADCARRLEVAGVGAVCVVEKSSITGIITERDLVRALSRSDNPKGALVREFMSKDVMTADVEEGTREVAHRMLDAEIRHLPAVRDGYMVGMVSMRDLLQAETWL
jgi:signal-transduction protein with cAMP-binding, CBS, and nucleotidyltransferase domain